MTSENIPTFATERLLIREITDKDTDAIFSLYSNEIVAGGMGITRLEQRTAAQQMIEYFNHSYKEKSMIRFGMVLPDSDTLIGTIGFQDIKWEYYLSEIGFDLNPEYHNKGYMTEALRPVIDYGFTKLQFQKLFALSYVENVAAHSVLEKCGFTKEGRLLQHTYNWCTKKFTDMYAYGLIKNDWKEND